MGAGKSGLFSGTYGSRDPESTSKSKLIITKTDTKTHLPLSGAVFKVEAADGIVVGNVDGEYTTDIRGEICIVDVKPGVYIISEITAPQGYIMTTSPKAIRIKTDGKTHLVVFNNELIV